MNLSTMDIQKTSALLQEHLKFLRKWDLSFLGDESVPSALLGERLLLIYKSRSTGRSVRIYFSEARQNKPERLAVFIDSGNGQSFYLDDYLAKHDLKKLVSFFYNSAPEKLENIFFEDFAKILRIVFENSFSDLLSGRTWDIAPFDWSPYR